MIETVSDNRHSRLTIIQLPHPSNPFCALVSFAVCSFLLPAVYSPCLLLVPLVSFAVCSCLLPDVYSPCLLTPSCVGGPSTTTSSTLPPHVWGAPQRQPLQHYPFLCGGALNDNLFNTTPSCVGGPSTTTSSTLPKYSGVLKHHHHGRLLSHSQ